ncbi:MAG: tetratricopeptide repeat protein [Akkermansiaceae bacterium]|jgi:tetratricopeptide (TPR) repeat protein|nr:tetratricopeptide repeat protein [Akkermansiaceae bacterium]MDP4647387.1 tetratricopeptide repeat protein [Akkermansiaceae bacterium]MDP4721599.1 tetratricopeptide repeat protein [Akkermansiaceae bacterium]MDP4779539.1 tetratricopeptide repeat protein [Akkermansiaceae bacterium]MDP4847357.1 tetratricopeptide repeat protein [Akkermansiaceae bacterium]
MPEITDKELSPAAKPLWLKAMSAVQMNNLDYAVNLLQAVLKEEPGFLKGRQVLRGCEIQLLGGVAKKKSMFGGGGMSVMKLTSQAKKDPVATLPLIEKELEKDPTSDAANDLLFDTAMKMDLPKTAAFALETIRKHNPQSVKLLHKLAEHYLAQEDPLKASEVYNDIIKQVPNDGPAIKGAKDASARASMKKQRWDENTSMKDLMRDSAANEELEKASRTGLTREQLEMRRDKAIEKYNADANNLAASKELAGLYEQLEDWANAHTFYKWAHSLSNGDVALETKASLMHDHALEAELAALEKALATDPDNAELKAQYDAALKERLAEQVAEAKRRIDQNPTDPQLRYELGSALYKSGDYTGAIPHLQQATRNPHIRTKVLLLLGRTFRAKGMFDLSIKQLTDALADLHAMDGIKKEVLYEKGLIHQEVGDKPAALDAFKQIYEVDYGYRDVAKRVESSYEGD